MSIQIYSTNKQRFGSFWGLYLVGIKSIFDLKYSIGQLLVTLSMQFIVTLYTNEIIINTNNQLDGRLIFNAIIICIAKITMSIVAHQFTRIILTERLQISQRIATYINQLYINAPNTWKSHNGTTAQKESMREIFNAYDNMTNMIAHTLQTSIESAVMLIIALKNDWSIGAVIIIGSYILYKIKKYLNTELSTLDKNMGDTMNTVQLLCANQFTNRADIRYTPKYETLFNADQYNPVHGFTKSCQIWDDRTILSSRTNTIITSVRPVIIAMLSAYLWSIQKPELIIFVIVNSNNLFGFLDVITQLEEVKDISGSRVASSFKMIDELELNENIPTEVMADILNIDQIVIKNIHRIITKDISLIYNGHITIDLNKQGIILLNGPKGCGKTQTIELLAGIYDGTVTDGVYVNGVEVHNEFRDLRNHRTYVRQCITDDYKSNKKNTIYMTLAELFPNGTYGGIYDFLINFDMAYKIPTNMDICISVNEQGLSPGECQAIILASQIWKAIQLNSLFLLLDEPERNIDFETVKKIFDKILDIYQGTIILITHSTDLKVYLSGNIKERWNYKPNNGGALSFTIDKGQICN